MNLFEHDIKAVIFDLDGTLIDSTSIWKDIDREFFTRRGMEVPSDYAEKIAHIGLVEAAKYTKKTYNIKETEEEIMQEWHNACKEKYLYTIGLKDGAKELLSLLKEKNIKIALATANDDSLYIPLLKRLGIIDYFTVLADVNFIKEGKNSVKIYDSITKKFNVKREETLVLEDIVTGLKTAYTHGYLAIGVHDKSTEDQEPEKKKYCHLFIQTFNELITLIK